MRQKDDKKIAQIFSATLQLVEQNGLTGITMCDISKAANLATGTLYIYFKNKEELINALFVECRSESAQFYFKNHNTADAVEVSFRKLFHNIVQYRLSHFEKFVFLEQCYHSAFIQKNKRGISSKALQPLFSLLNKGKQQNIIKKADNLLLTWYIMGCVNETAKGLHYRSKKMSKTTLAFLFRACWDGIKK